MTPYTLNGYQEIGQKTSSNNYMVRSQLGRGTANIQSSNFSVKWVLQGSESYQSSSRRFVLAREQFLLAMPGEAFKLEVADAASGCCFYFNTKHIKGLISELTSKDIEGAAGTVPDIASIRLEKHGYQLGLSLSAVANKACDADIHLLSNYLAETIVKLSQLSNKLPFQRKSTQQELLARLELARSFIIDVKDQPITLEDIERVACLSRFHLTRLFTRVYGAPPLRFHQNLKLDSAREQIQAGVPIKTIAEVLGFSALSAFSRAYRRRHGASPSTHSLK